MAYRVTMYEGDVEVEADVLDTYAEALAWTYGWMRVNHGSSLENVQTGDRDDVTVSFTAYPGVQAHVRLVVDGPGQATT